jgi:hypothetical protein
MRHRQALPGAIPDWFLETVRVMQDTGHGVRRMDTQLRYAMGLRGLDERLRVEMQQLRDALGTVKVGLSVIDMIANQVLAEIALEEKPKRGADAA